MSKVLGIDLGTNSIGWAIVEKNNGETNLLDNGVHIFQEGVNRVKGNEEPAVKTRTAARLSRRHYFRKRQRKINLLKILIEKSWCPYLSDDEITLWREKKLFPLDKDFLKWLTTDKNTNRNPYFDRHRCLNEVLDLTKQSDRYTLGRALYHINQRRGFISNRKDQGAEEENGKVKSSISELTSVMKNSGCEYLGDYFYKLYQEGGKIRNHYTDRQHHYISEFRAICEKQNIDLETCQALFNAIFFQRPLKSQKGLVGKCPFEKGKPRCQISHPAFEEFRMLCFINNIRLALPGEERLRPLNEKELDEIVPLFYRKSKDSFDFSDISRRLAGKRAVPTFCSGKEAGDKLTFRINFRDDVNVSGCPITAQLMSIFGEKWKEGILERYVMSYGKSEQQVIDDVWHALSFYDDDTKLKAWGKEKLQLTESESDAFIKIKVPQGYASLCLCAIRKILPWLQSGYRYDEAAMLANIGKVVDKNVWEKRAGEILPNIISAVSDYIPNPDIKNDSKIRKIEEELCNLGVYDMDLSKIYSPSSIELFPKALPNNKGIVLLGSPRTNSIRNPMAMRSLFRLKSLVNELIKDGKIDKSTKINIELARNLNDYNTRRAIELLQRENEKNRVKYKSAIEEYYREIDHIGDASEDDILKYELWEEQKHICLYTGKQIPISGFLGANPIFDIEHTIPKSRGGDNSKANKTLCDSQFNRKVKKGYIPSELSNSVDVISRVIATGWEDEVDRLRKEIYKASKTSKSASTKDVKDRALQKKRMAKMRMEYLQNKINRFKMTEVPEGFANRQGVNIGVIGRYARMYMQSVFERVYTVKGETTAEFRKMWGLQDNYSKKQRTNHCHHCIDAITIACIGKFEYEMWAQYKQEEENHYLYGGSRPRIKKPWDTFTEDVKSITNSLLVSHYCPDNMGKQSKKLLRVRGAIQRDSQGKPKVVQGNSARGSLHLQTYYGAILKGEDIQYVVRKELSSLAEKDITNIVDDAIREKVQKAVSNGGLAALTGNIWMNEEKKIPIKKVRLFMPTVTKPLSLKDQRFKSDLEHKRKVYVVNESNYAYVVYEGQSPSGKIKRSFKIVTNLEAARKYNSGEKDIFPQTDENGYNFLFALKAGTMALFYENSKDELYSASKDELSKRLYKVFKYSSNSMVGFIYHQEARPTGDIEFRKGAWLSDDEFRPIMMMGHNQIKALIEGYDFTISVSGNLVFINK